MHKMVIELLESIVGGNLVMNRNDDGSGTLHIGGSSTVYSFDHGSLVVNFCKTQYQNDEQAISDMLAQGIIY